MAVFSGRKCKNNITFHYDVLNGLIKSAAFGVAVTLIAVHQGFHWHRLPKVFCAPVPHRSVFRPDYPRRRLHVDRMDVYRLKAV